MKKYNPDKLKKIHVYPLIIILIIVVFIVGVAISFLAGAVTIIVGVYVANIKRQSIKRQNV